MSNGSGAAVTGLVIGLIMGLGAIDSDEPSPASDESSADSASGSSSGDSTASSPDGTGWGLDVPGVIRTTGRSGQTVALTFSSGPDPKYTPEILDILDTDGVKATFCILGTQAERYPELVRQIAANGHVLCNHTLNYDYALAARDDATIRADIEGGLNAIRAAVPDASVPFFRAPGGNFSPELVDTAAAFDEASLGWNVDPRDWETPGAAAIQAAVVDAVQPGSIVVLHDEGPNRGGTVEALPGIIDELMAEGYQFVTPAS
ncbi:MAG TPA: polysaccharide deacetylase family protein [Jiangellaceae bacterium]|nr:polysaccharide deacetylase family protein [Jiangellaceae bacterium]